MRIAFILVASLMLSVSAFAADDTADTANRAKFEKECAVMIAPGGPCADVPKGDGGRRGCVSKPENFAVLASYRKVPRSTYPPPPARERHPHY